MIHRLAAFLIIGFWIAMTGLLVVREIYPEATRLNQVPVSYVAQLCFQHRHASQLNIYEGDTQVGFLNVEPLVQGRTRVLRLHGNLTFQLAGMRQHVIGKSDLELDSAGNVSHLLIEDLALSEAGQQPTRRLRLEVDYKTQLLTYSLRPAGDSRDRDEQQVEETTISLDQAGMAKIFERLGLDSSLFKTLQMTQQEAPPSEFEAQESSTSLNGEKVNTYLVSLKVGGQTAFEAHVDQLGQILRAKIPLLNLRLATKDVNP